MVRGWVRLSLRGSEFRLVGEASTAAEAEALIMRRRPDLLIVDYRLPDVRGTELVRDLRRRGVTAPAVLMTANSEPGFNESAEAAGAHGSVLKTGAVEEFLATLRMVLAGKRTFDARYPRAQGDRPALSPREREVLKLVADGATNEEIAVALGVGRETVKTLLARTCAKLGVRRRSHAVSAAHRLGVL